MNPVLRGLHVDADGRRLLLGRGLRGFADGLVSVVLSGYLLAIGYSPVQIGAIVTSTLLGSAAATLGTGLIAHRVAARTILLGACVLMFATGVSFTVVTAFLPLLLIAFVGTLNPTSGDVSLFLPVEQSMLAGAVAPENRTALYARYNLIALGCGALGSLASAAPSWIAGATGMTLANAMRLAFLTYAAVAAVVGVAYLGLERTPRTPAAAQPRRPLERSRAVVIRLATLFTLDAFGGGFVAQSVLALWLFQRFDLSLTAAASFFFVTTLLAGLSQLASPWLAARIGLVRTMVYTHIPANVFLMLAALMPTLPLTMTFLYLRMTLSSMDQPARQALVMAVVPPEERAAAASVTSVPRSLGSALSPAIAGWLLAHSTFGWPLLLAGALKIVYDLLLLVQFRHHLTEHDGRS